MPEPTKAVIVADIHLDDTAFFDYIPWPTRWPQMSYSRPDPISDGLIQQNQGCP